MSKDNVSVDDILQEFSPNGQTVDTKDTSNSDEKSPIQTVQPEKSLEQLEHERLEAISQGELSDSAINYASFTNKPNRIIENPKKDNSFNEYYTKGVVKINSRPDRKETVKDKHTQSKVSNNQNDNTSNVSKKIDSRNDKAKLESSNNKRNYARSHNEISNEDFMSMSEKLKRAKEKKQQEIDKLNYKYNVTKENYIDNSTNNIDDTTKNIPNNDSVQDNKDKIKKSLWSKIVDYYTIPVDETEEQSIKNNDTQSSDSNSSKDNNLSTINEVSKENTSVEIETTPKKKETFKEFIVDLFTSPEKPTPKKKETFKQRMIDFFVVDDDDEISKDNEIVKTVDNSNQTVDEIVSNIVEDIHNNNTNSSTNNVSNEIDNLLNNLVDNVPSKEDTVSKEEPKEVLSAIEATSKAETSVEDNVIKNTPIIKEEQSAQDINTKEVLNNISKDTTEQPLISEDTSIENLTSKEKKPNIFKRIKNFLLMEELAQLEEQSAKEEVTSTEEIKQEDTTKEVKENIFETFDMLQSEPIQETQEDVSKELKTQLDKVEPLEEQSKPIENNIQESSKETILNTPITDDNQTTFTSNDDTSILKENSTDTTSNINDDDYIIPFSEDNSKNSIDIPIEESIKYKHFWQDPDFNPIDRFKSYIEDTAEKHRNRKRSGEIHIEIKSTPDASILFSNVENGILAEQKIMESREKFKQQVLNGEYDNYDENLKKNVDIEPTFNDTSLNDFNSYEEKSTIKSYINEMKTGLLIRTIITSVLCILSLYITLANDMSLPIFDTLNTQISASGYLMVQSAVGLVAILTSIKSIISGIVKIFKRKSDSDSFASVGIVSAFLSSLLAFFMADTLVETKMLNIYMPIALLGLLSNLIGKMLIVKREENNFKYISRNKQKFGLFCMQDDYDAEKVTKGLVNDYPVTAYKKKSEFTSDFIKYTYSYDMADRFSKFAVPTITIISIIVSIISALVYNKTFNMVIPIGIISVFSMLISFCSCFSLPIYINSMLYNVSNRYAKREGALLGYQAVEDFYDTNSIIIDANDIFPKGSINISALKLFSDAKIDQTLIYGISLAYKTKSILAPTLLDMLDGNLDMLCNVENCSYEDGLGICGWIDNKRVLMGNRELMEAHNIENLPSKSKEMELVGSKRDGIYISISGNLALMLIVDIVPNKKVKYDLNNLQNSGISMAITSCDFLVSVNRMNYLFGIDEDNIKVIPYEVYQETKEYFAEKPKCSTSIVTNGDIGMITNMLITAKKIHKHSLIGNIIHAVACIVGIIIGISFITMGAFRELTPTMILVYNLICSAVTMLICNWRKF